MIPRDLNPVLRATHKLFKFSTAMPVAGVLGLAGYFVRTDERQEYFIGNAEEFFDGVLDAYSILFRCALNYPGSKILLLVRGILFEFDPALYVESESPWLRIKLCLSVGYPLN